MAVEFRETLVRKIASLEAELTAVRAALAAYDRVEGQAAPQPGSPGKGRFTGMRPTFRAVEIVLKENGGRMSRSSLMDELIAGGATYGKKRDVNTPNNLRISIDDNAKLGKLKLDGDDVILL